MEIPRGKPVVRENRQGYGVNPDVEPKIPDFEGEGYVASAREVSPTHGQKGQIEYSKVDLSPDFAVGNRVGDVVPESELEEDLEDDGNVLPLEKINEGSLPGSTLIAEPYEPESPEGKFYTNAVASDMANRSEEERS
jgi:hypothetical protein